MNQAGMSRFEVTDPIHGPVPCAALLPTAVTSPLPLCLFLYGGGGSRESLAELQPLVESLWQSGRLPPLLLATPDVGPFSFYLDDPKRGLGWESFIVERFIPSLGHRFSSLQPTAAVGLVGVSMGGYGCLKIALARPGAFAAVAAISPMIEPAHEVEQVRPRNRYHYPPPVPQALLGPDRDVELYRADHPAVRALRHAAELRGSALAIYIDAAGRDALHAHDGAEYLHRVLWDLDVAHEYRLRRDADHIGPDLVERLAEALVWVGTRVVPPAAAPLSELESAWQDWLDGRSAEPPAAPLAPVSRLFGRLLRTQLTAARRTAEACDSTVSRRNGLLPPVVVPSVPSDSTS
jgi:S-formylglutathione hydrolase